MVDGFAESDDEADEFSRTWQNPSGPLDAKEPFAIYDWHKKIQQVISIYQALEDRTVELPGIRGRPGFFSRDFRAA